MKVIINVCDESMKRCVPFLVEDSELMQSEGVFTCIKECIFKLQEKLGDKNKDL